MDVAAYLGTDHPTGRALAREAWDVFDSIGAANMKRLFADGLLPPSEAVSEAG